MVIPISLSMRCMLFYMHSVTVLWVKERWLGHDQGRDQRGGVGGSVNPTGASV